MPGDVATATEWGTVEAIESPENRDGRETYAFIPSSRLDGHVPMNFRLEFTVHRGKKGHRFICPVDSWNPFILLAALGGHGILEASGSRTDEMVFSAHFARLTFQWRSRVREWKDYEFPRRSDLSLTTPERDEKGRTDVLPDDLGFPPGDEASGKKRWTPTKLMEAGCELARESGIDNPTDAECIRWGFVAAGRRHPFDVASLSSDECASIVRSSVFGFGPAVEKVPAEIRDRVAARLSELLEKHAEYDTDAFHTWWLLKLDNVVHAIAKRKRGGGPIDRALVREVVLQLVWEAYEWIGQGVHAQMRAIQNGLAEPLDRVERARFDLFYQRQEWLGNLPLSLLLDQCQQVREAVQPLLDDPTDAGGAGPSCERSGSGRTRSSGAATRRGTTSSTASLLQAAAIERCGLNAWKMSTNGPSPRTTTAGRANGIRWQPASPERVTCVATAIEMPTGRRPTRRSSIRTIHRTGLVCCWIAGDAVSGNRSLRRLRNS